MHLLRSLAVFGQLIALVLSAELRIQISPSNILPNPSILPPSTHATLTGTSGELRALIRKDNTILFPEIPSTGSHLLKIYSRDYVFAPYRIDIITGSSSKSGNDDGSTAATQSSTTQISGIYETFPGTQWSDHGIALIPADSPALTYTLHPKTVAKKNFYEERQGFNVLALLKNPMILLGGAALLFTFGMPKLMENMDPEMRAEFEEMQKKGPAASLGRAMAGQSVTSGGGSSGGAAQGLDLAGYLAGSGSSKSSAPSKTTGRESGGNARERKK